MKKHRYYFFVLFALVSPVLTAQDNGLSFDGIDDYVAFASNTAFNSTRTFEAWIYPTTTSGVQTIAEWTDGADNILRFYMNNNRLELLEDDGFNGGFVSGTGTLTANQWNHVAFVETGSGFIFYIDGIADIVGFPTGSAGPTPIFNLASIRSGFNYFSGIIDEVRVWNAEISQATIESRRFSELTGGEANLIAYYQFNETSGTVLPDLTANNIDGTLLNGLTNTPPADGIANGPLWVASTALPDPFIVTNTNNSGTGSLRWCIGNANATAGPNTITFSIPAGSVINVDSRFQLTDNGTTIVGDGNGDFVPDVTINSGNPTEPCFEILSQDNRVLNLAITGFSSNAAFRLDGAGATNNLIAGCYMGLRGDGTPGANQFGVVITNGANDNIVGNAGFGYNIISGNSINGIYIESATGNRIYSSIIGLDRSGLADLPNLGQGVYILDAINTVIGSVGEGNIISGNSQEGIEIDNSTNTIVSSNIIGLDINGNTAIGNGRPGVYIRNVSDGTQIGLGITNGGNVISGNTGQGIDIESRNITILANTIGLDASGLNARPNSSHGIWIELGATGINVGNDNADGRNIISGNGLHGILVSEGSNTIRGNYIGLGEDGNTLLGNNGIGVFLANGTDNFVGGTVAGEGNVIAGNSVGISISTATNKIYGNIIGLNASGTVARGNNGEGIRLTANAQANDIGDGTAAGANIVSGNGADGILLSGVGVIGNAINFNYIGTNNAGDNLGNTQSGVLLASGTTGNSFPRNTIAFNQIGIRATGNTTLSNVWTQNSIYGNVNNGISIELGAQNGVTAPVITNIATDGTVTGTSEPNAIIDIYADAVDQGEYLYGAAIANAAGDWTFTGILANIPNGLNFFTATQTETVNSNSSAFAIPFDITTVFDPLTVINTNDAGIGSLRWTMGNANTIAGPNTILFNIPTTDPGYTNISGERWTILPTTELPRITDNLTIDATTQPGTGNFRIMVDGQDALTNGFDVGSPTTFYGLYITNFTRGIYDNFGGSMIIGDINKGNVINSCGTGISSATASNHIIKGNFIGTNEFGTVAVSNNTGLGFTTGSNIIIGGSLPGEGNVISGNTGNGINFNVGVNNRVEGNFIGTDGGGGFAIPNGTGVNFGTGSGHMVINNIISGNSVRGVGFNNGGGVTFHGNKIGVGANGTDPIPNNRGIASWTFLGGANNIIGGLGPGEANIIAHNTNQGVYLRYANNINNSIINNSIFSNGGKGIDLEGTGNNNKTAPVITDYSTGSAGGTGTDGDIIHLYRDNSGTAPLQGLEYLGTATVAGGTWTISETSILPTDLLNATATDAANNTSEFAINYGEIMVFLGPDISGQQIFDSQAGVIDLGQTSQGTDLDQVFTIRNASSATLTINSISTGGTDYSIVTAPVSVGPNTTASFTVRMSGTTSGVFSDLITIDSDDEDEAIFTFNVTGEVQAPLPFITTWITTDGQITIPLTGTGYNYDVVWTNLTNAGVGDGFTTSETTSLTITGLENGSIYQIEISGTFPRIYFNNSSPNREKILTVEQWGDIAWTSMADAFEGCLNLTIPAVDAPDLSNVTDMSRMFSGAESITESLDHWDVSNITTMASTFSNATSFNGTISNWDVSNVVNFFQCFSGATAFNQPLNWTINNTPGASVTMLGMFSFTSFNQDLSSWDVSEVISMSQMFYGNDVFNENITNWDVRKVTSFSLMFRDNSSFNQDISNWQLNSALSISQMFLNATSFNQPIGNWGATTGNITDMSGTFRGADAFNQPIDAWDVSSVTNMDEMFTFNNVFNQDLNSWDVSSVQSVRRMFWSSAAFNGNIADWNLSSCIFFTEMFLTAQVFNQPLNWTLNTSAFANIQMDGMFEGSIFNQDISSWDVSRVQNMRDMFRSNTAFNGSVAGWDVTNVQIFSDMFRNASNFDQSLGTWDVGAAVLMDNMLSSSGMSTANYDATLIGWNSLPSLQPNVTLGAAGIRYCLAETERNNIISTYGWTIGDGGLLCPVTIPNDPIDLFVTEVSNTQLDLSWTDNSLDETGFIIERSLGNNSTYLPIITVGADVTTYTDNTVTAGNGYFYRVSATNAAGDSGPSNEKFGSTITPPGHALDFDGLDDYVDLGNLDDIFAGNEGSLSIEFWFNSGPTGVENEVLLAINGSGGANDNQLLLIIRTDDQIALNDNSNTATQEIVGPVVTDNEWHHLAYTRNGTLGTLYLDGTIIGTHTADFPVNAGDLWSLGQEYDGIASPGNFYDGLMDEVRIWNTVRTEADINANLYNTFVGNEAGLVAYYRFDQGIPGGDNTTPPVNLLPDRSLNNFNGSLIGFGLNGPSSNWVDSQVAFTPFITTWVTTDGQITIPTTGGGYSYDISWTNLDNAGVGDGAANGATGSFTINGLSNGDRYQVSISGTFPRIYFNNGTEAAKLISIDQWGELTWDSMVSAFAGCLNMTVNTTDVPDLSNVTDMTQMFFGATLFNTDISGWDVSNVTNMSNLFSNTAFNQNIGGWDVSNVTNMSGMFTSCPFNQDISGWSVDNVTNISGMFRGSSFNQNIGSWNVGNVNFMVRTFQDSPFNQDIGSWDVSSVTDFTNTFRSTPFNQDISSWDVSAASSMANMFVNNLSFNQNLGAWDISNVNNMSGMLANTAMSIDNYDATLIGWHTLDVGETQIPTGINLGANGLEYCNSLNERNDLISTYSWTFTGDSENCVACASPPTANAGGDFNIEAGSSATLSATIGGAASTLTWTTSGDGSFDDNTSASAVYTPGPEDIANGSVTLTLTTDDPDGTGPCVAATDFLILTINPVQTNTFNIFEGPDLSGNPIEVGQVDINLGSTTIGVNLDRDFTIENNQSTTVNISAITSTNPAFEVVNAPTGVLPGTSEIFTIRLVAVEVGVFTADINITSDFAPFNFSVIGEVTATEPGAITVYNALSPNGDGRHDYLEIQGIDFFPSNRVVVMNRWGDVVFDASGYNNSNVRFEGLTNNGSELPPGTYFYQIDLGDGSGPQTGFISLRR